MSSIKCHLFDVDVGHSRGGDLGGKLRDLPVGEKSHELHQWLVGSRGALARMRAVMSHYPGATKELARRLVISTDTTNSRQSQQLFFITAGLRDERADMNLRNATEMVPFERVRVRSDYIGIDEGDRIHPYRFTDEGGLPYAVHSAKGIVKVLSATFKGRLATRALTTEPIEKQIEDVLHHRKGEAASPTKPSITDALTIRLIELTSLCVGPTTQLFVNSSAGPVENSRRARYLLRDLSLCASVVRVPHRVTGREWHSRTKAAFFQLNSGPPEDVEKAEQPRDTASVVGEALARYCTLMAAMIRLSVAAAYRPPKAKKLDEGYAHPGEDLYVLAGPEMQVARPWALTQEPALHLDVSTEPGDYSGVSLWPQWLAVVTSSNKATAWFGGYDSCLEKALELGKEEGREWMALTLYCSINQLQGVTTKVAYKVADLLTLRLNDIRQAIAFMSAG